MSEEIKQKDKLKDGFEDLVINDTGKNFDDDMFIIQDWWLKQFDSLLSQALQKQRKEIIKLIKTPMSTEFEDPEEESADYSIEDFRARLLSTLTTK